MPDRVVSGQIESLAGLFTALGVAVSFSQSRLFVFIVLVSYSSSTTNQGFFTAGVLPLLGLSVTARVPHSVGFLFAGDRSPADIVSYLLKHPGLVSWMQNVSSRPFLD